MPQTKTSPESKSILGSFLKKPTKLSKPQLAVFIAIFAVIGAYLIYRSFATAPLVATLEAEQMSLVPGSSVITDTSASSGKALLLSSNGTTTGSVNFPSSVTSLSLIAKGTQCSGSPTMNVSLDGVSLLSNQAVSSTSWSAYAATPTTAINSGTHNLSISFTNAYTSTGHGKHSNGYCTRSLYLDVTSFFGPTPTPTPAPTVSLSATPTSVSAGSASVLTWNSTNATACTASGAWSGAQPTSGSQSTGALNQTSTYNLSCTGAGGTATTSVVITVTAVVLNPACTKVLAATDDLLTVANAAHPGDVLCLPPSAVYSYSGNIDFRIAIGTASAPLTITSQDHTRPATILGRIVTHPPVNYLTFSYLKLNGKNSTAGPSPTIGSDHITLQHNDITNDNTAICVHPINDSTYGTAHYTVIDQNRIHNCGVLPSTNGDHGVYDLGFYTTITNNYVYDNADRGLQMRGSQGAMVKYNTVNNNGEGIIFGDLGASNNDVGYNIFSNSNIRYNVESFWGTSTPGTGNNFHDNCLWTTRTDAYYDNQTIQPGLSGVTVTNVKYGNPLYTNSATKDFSLQSGSACGGYGVQPGVKPGIN